MSIVVELVQFAFVYGSDAQLALDRRDQRRTLEEGARKGLEGASQLSFAAGEPVVQADDAHVLFAGALLRLDQPGGPVETDDQTTGDLGVEGAAVTGFFDPALRISTGTALTR